MTFEHYIYSDGKRLRRGYTTGTCAALAAQGAAELLLLGTPPKMVSLPTPAGIEVSIKPDECSSDGTYATCTVTKDAGDDYDVTDRTAIRARVCRIPAGVSIEGGEGVGRVTQPGLDQPVGSAAINSGPRKMIARAVQEVCELAGYDGGLSVIIEVPQGEQLAHKTFNPQIGIIGGISILGTSGIVEPQSLKALMDTLEVEVHARAAAGSKRLIITPGNYGENFLASFGLPCDIPIVKCANFIGQTVDRAVIEGFEEVLVVGHIGKLVKVAGGIMDTHSRMADCRVELFAAHAAACGASQETVLALFDAATTDACLAILDDSGIREEVLARIADAVQSHLDRRVDGALRIGAVIFSNRTGLLRMTDEGRALVNIWKERA